MAAVRLLDERHVVARRRLLMPSVCFADIAMLRDRLIEQFAGKLEDAELDVPWTAQRVVHAIHERATVLSEQHHDAGTRLTIRAPSRVVSELRAALKPAS